MGGHPPLLLRYFVKILLITVIGTLAWFINRRLVFRKG